MSESGPTWDEFVTGWELGLYSDPVLCGIVAGLVLGYLGVFVVLRRMVFVTAAISQASGLGVALSFYSAIHLGTAVHPVIGAVVLALLAAGLFTVNARSFGLSQESLLGLFYLATWAGAVIVGDRIAQESHDIKAILFGTAVLVQPLDVILVLSVGVVVLLLMVVFHRGLVFATFDPVSARIQGVRVRMVNLLGWTLLALEVSVATRALGVLPVFAFAVLPAMTALMVARKRIRIVLFLAALFGAVSGGAGYIAAFFFELPVGACQAMTAVAIFGLMLPVPLVGRRRE